MALHSSLLLTPTHPYMHSSWPQQCFTFRSGFQLNLVTIIRHFWAIWPLIDPSWPLHDLLPINALQCSQGFFLINLVGKQFDPSWPIHDLWPQQCITLRSSVLTIKFGGHRVFPKQRDLWMNLTFFFLKASFWPSVWALKGPVYTTISQS